MESIDDNFALGEMKLNAQSIEHLRLTARWSQFLSILGFVGLGLMLIGVFGLSAMQERMSYSRIGSQMDNSVMMVVYLVLIVVYFFPIYYLYQFSSRMKKALEIKDTMTFTEATGFLKNHFQFLGVCAIIVLSLYALAFVVGIGAAMI